MRYRIRIEKWDDTHNLLIQSQVEVLEQEILENQNQIDILELHFKQLLEQFKQYEQNQSR